MKISSKPSLVRQELEKELAKLWHDENNWEFIRGVIESARTEENWKFLLDYIKRGKDVSANTVTLLALELESRFPDSSLKKKKK